MKHLTRKTLIASCVVFAWQAAAGGQAMAQSGGQAPGTTATPTTPQPPASGATPGRLQTGDAAMSAATFIERARAGNAFEIESSKLALEKATQPALKNFARSMIDDHSKAEQRLTSVATDIGQRGDANVTMEPRQRRNIDALQAATGAEFDKLYAKQQLEAHQMSVQLYESYSESGTEERLRDFARETLPILQGHLKQIENMNQ